MKPTVNTPISARQSSPVVTTTMKNIPRLGNRIPGPPIPPSSNTDTTGTLIEALRQRVNELEERLTALENVVQVDGGDVVISATRSVLIQGLTSVEVSAGGSFKVTSVSYECNSPLTAFTGVVQCDTLIANSVVSASYTPGAGNVW